MAFTQNDVEIIKREVCFQGFFRIERFHLKHKLFSGGVSSVIVRELFERGDAIAVIPYDPITKQVVLIEQFRIGALDSSRGPWILEIIAGVIDKGETAEQVAHREGKEEAGCDFMNLWPICEYLVSPGGTSERISVYCAQVDATEAGGIHGLVEEGEDIRVVVKSLAEALDDLESGVINSANPIIALQWLALNHQKVEDAWLINITR